MTDVIRYQDLREMESKEKGTKSLQPIDEGFFKKVNLYIKQKHQMLSKIEDKKDNIFSQTSKKKIEKELVNVIRVFKNLIQLREHKISQLALMRTVQEIDPEKNMTKLEVKLYKSLSNAFEDFEKKFEDTSRPDLTKVEILKDVPKFKLRDSLFGPYKKDDKVELPTHLAETLINGKKAKIISDEDEDTKKEG